MKPKWQKLASLAQEMCTLWFQFFGAVFASKGYLFKNILDVLTQTIFCLFTIYLYRIGKIVNKRSIVCDRLTESRVYLACPGSLVILVW